MHKINPIENPNNTIRLEKGVKMRAAIVLATMIAGISVLYKWRYKLMNTILAISFLRKITVAITMNMPAIRNKILPKIFSSSTHQ